MMVCYLRNQLWSFYLHPIWCPTFRRKINSNVTGTLTLTSSLVAQLRLPPRRFTVLSSQSSPNVTNSTEPSLLSSEFTSSVGSPSLNLSPSQWTLSQRHFTVINIAACAFAISATWLFCAAIPTLLAFKRAAESMEKLMDVARKELPGTMAAVRLSGMEISDLTTELSDLGQEITQGVRSSTRAVRVTEEKLHHFANMTSRAPMQMVTNTKTTTAEPALARSARGMREGIVKGRAMLQMFFALTRFSMSIFSYLSNRSKRRALNK